MLISHITALFWAIKILATTLGETAGDYFSQTLELGTFDSAIILVAVFLVAVTFQLRANRFHPALFWFVAILTSTASTTIPDYINSTSHLAQATGALILGIGLAVVLLVWWRSGQTLNGENVATVAGEVLFWIAFILTRPWGAEVGNILSKSRDHGGRSDDRDSASSAGAIDVAPNWVSSARSSALWPCPRPIAVVGNERARKLQ
ncbi:hypothetical protein [Mycolicibacterium sp.]|uniref:hypothetical protein n=1 Tax=Mycolicibacterium sp. TaxID=2320850 RepID=UPI001A22A7D8|nr:hypothetical protein [Mycolicibacterium sp.]MBJ7340693.1 hypothetical protein [Mycolicibacterium sp.]